METKIAFQDYSLEELQLIVREQQNQIDELKIIIQKIHERASIHPEEGIIDIGLEVPPPHY